MIELIKTDKTLSEMPPLSWRIWSDEADAGKGIVVMTDSHGHHAFLNMRPNPWDIAADGVVSPSVHYLDCGWHDFVKLVGWNNDV